MKTFVWACVGAVFLGVACDEPQNSENLGEDRQNLSSDNQRILGFERVSSTPAQSDWLTTGGALSSATPATQGSQALGLANIGWAQLESAPLSALGAVSSVVKLDLRVPGTGTVPWGDVQIHLNSPQLAIWNQPLGQKLLGGTPAGSYQTIEIELPSVLVTKLAGSGYNDLVVRIALNLPQSSAAVLVDRLTFGEPSNGGGGAGGSSSSGGSISGGASSGSAGQPGISGGSAGSGGDPSGGAGTSGSGGAAGSAGAGSGGADVGPCSLLPITENSTTPYAFFDQAARWRGSQGRSARRHRRLRASERRRALAGRAGALGDCHERERDR